MSHTIRLLLDTVNVFVVLASIVFVSEYTLPSFCAINVSESPLLSVNQ